MNTELTERYRSVAHGLALIRAAIVLFGVAAALLILAAVTNWRDALALWDQRVRDPFGTLALESPNLTMLAVIANNVALVAAILCLLGHLRCASVPEEAASHGLLRAATALQAALVVHLLWDMLARFDAAPPVPSVVSWLVTAGWLAAWGLLWAFMRRLSLSIARKDLRKETGTFLTVLVRPDIVAAAGSCVVACGVAASNGLMPWSGVGGVVAAALVTALLVRFAALLRHVQHGTTTFAELLIPRGGV